MDSLKVTAVAPWYGGNRMLAQHVGRLLEGCTWVGVPFAGGMSELAHITARTLVVNDLHRHVINLAACIADDTRRQKLVKFIARLPFHPDVLREAQKRCRESTPDPRNGLSYHLAGAYFVTQWMGRSGCAGKHREFESKLPVRWNANGGDSNTRYRSALKSLAAWAKIMKRCNFTVLDFREFLATCKDDPKHGIYSDSPFPDGGAEYLHNFEAQDFYDLRDALAKFRHARVVVRYYDHPLIRELYPEGQWHWTHLTGRKSSNAAAPEVLITNFDR